MEVRRRSRISRVILITVIVLALLVGVAALFTLRQVEHCVDAPAGGPVISECRTYWTWSEIF